MTLLVISDNRGFVRFMVSTYLDKIRKKSLVCFVGSILFRWFYFVCRTSTEDSIFLKTKVNFIESIYGCVIRYSKLH